MTRFCSLLISLTALALPLSAEEILYESQPVGGSISATEGPVADTAGNLYFCSLTAKDGSLFDKTIRGSIGILRAGADQAEVLVELPEGMRFNGLRLTPWGTLLGADSVGKRIGEVNLESGEVTVYYTFPPESDRPNDVAIAKDGTLYVSLPPAAIWQLSKNEAGEVEGKKIGGTFANGLELHPDETRLYTQQGAFTFGTDNQLEKVTGLRLAIPNDKSKFSFMDGMRFDQTGRLFMTRAGARQRVDGKVVRAPAVIHIFGPDGKLERNVELPYSSTTNVAFGGPDGRSVYTVHGPDGLAVFRTEHPGRNFGLFD